MWEREREKALNCASIPSQLNGGPKTKTFILSEENKTGEREVFSTIEPQGISAGERERERERKSQL